MIRGVVAALLAILGVLVGVAGAFSQSVIFRPGGVLLPVGLVVTLAGCLGAFVFGGRLMGSRIGAVCPAGTWFAVTAVFVAYQPHEDAVFDLADNAHGLITMAYILGGVLIAVGVSYTPWAMMAERETATPAKPTTGKNPAPKTTTKKTMTTTKSGKPATRSGNPAVRNNAAKPRPRG